MNAEEKQRAFNREWMRRYRATPEGKEANRRARQKCNATPSGKEKRVAARKRWNKSEKGRAAARRRQRKRYVAHPLPRLTAEERRKRRYQSWLRSVSKPHVKAKRDQSAWRARIRRTYGLTAEQYAEMAKNGCNICGSEGSPNRRLTIDHCHTTDRVRGVLCDRCNVGLGCFADNRERLAVAISYLGGV